MDKPLSLPAGAAIVGAFPEDCGFTERDESDVSLTFKSEKEAKSRDLGAGTWSFFPLKCRGVVVFLR